VVEHPHGRVTLERCFDAAETAKGTSGHSWLDSAHGPRDSTRMANSLRVFLVHDDDSVERIALARFERLVGRRDLSERWPEHAGKRLRYALLYLKTEDGEMQVVYTEFAFLDIDAEGRHSAEAYKRSIQDAMNMLGGLYKFSDASNVVGEQAFRQRRYKVEHKWEPSPATIEALREALVDGRGPRRSRSPRASRPS
jgi:hypothetical protein